MYTEAVIRLEEVGSSKVFVILLGIVCEDDVVGFGSTMRASLCFVKCTHSNRADMA
jgi:hypothetical protein